MASPFDASNTVPDIEPPWPLLPAVDPLFWANNDPVTIYKSKSIYKVLLIFLSFPFRQSWLAEPSRAYMKIVKINFLFFGY